LAFVRRRCGRNESSDHLSPPLPPPTSASPLIFRPAQSHLAFATKLQPPNTVGQLCARAKISDAGGQMLHRRPLGSPNQRARPSPDRPEQETQGRLRHLTFQVGPRSRHAKSPDSHDVHARVKTSPPCNSWSSQTSPTIRARQSPRAWSSPPCESALHARSCARANASSGPPLLLCTAFLSSQLVRVLQLCVRTHWFSQALL